MIENGMQLVTVHKSELLMALRENLDKHQRAYFEAEKGYRAAAIGALEKCLEDARDGKEFQTVVNLPKPPDHTRAYERAIRMLEMCVNDKVQITEDEFTHYVLDDWAWKQNFTATANNYAAGRLR